MCPYLEVTLLQVSNHDTIILSVWIPTIPIILSVWVPTMRNHNYSHNNQVSAMGTDRLSQPLQRYIET